MPLHTDSQGETAKAGFITFGLDLPVDIATDLATLSLRDDFITYQLESVMKIFPRRNNKMAGILGYYDKALYT
jgi:hypothetical protein